MADEVKEVDFDPVREKLIELVGQVQDDGCDYSNCFSQWDRPDHIENTVLVDHLIANGVTVAYDLSPTEPLTDRQQWIPVTERLPEVIGSYLVIVKYKYDFEEAYTIDTDVATYDPCGSGYIDNCWNTYIDWNEGQQFLHVTHWMPLPEPPKN